MTGSAAPVRDEPHSAPPQPAPPVLAPAASTLRLALLVAVVLATSGFVFLTLYTFVPDRLDRLTTAISACEAERSAAPGWSDVPVVTEEDLRRSDAADRRMSDCFAPVLLDQLAFIAGGVALLIGLALTSYLSHPWWIVRQRRLKRLSEATAPELWGHLEQLSREMGLGRSPDWRIAPFTRTTGGQAFGLPWHRYVQLDAGLLVLHATNRPAFRAVVRHELAHLRHEDVDRTYLAIGIWRAFVAVALLPYLVLTLHPEMLRTPLDWHWRDVQLVAYPGQTTYRLVSLLVLTAVVYLTRNAILRERETYADVLAAGRGDGDALRAVLGRLPPLKHRWSRWGTHPDPRRRLATVVDHRLLSTTSLWELAGVGIAAGLVCSNAGFLVGINLLANPRLAYAAVGVLVGAVAVALLAVAIWRAVAIEPVRAPSALSWVVGPAALVAGFAGGSHLSLQVAAIAGASGIADSPSAWVVSILLLMAGGVAVAAWITSTARGVLTAPAPASWAMPAVVVVAALVGALLFAVWLPTSKLETGFAIRWGGLPAAGADIGWYGGIARWAEVRFDAAYRLVFNPFTLPFLTLLWLTPVIIRRCRIRGTADDQPLRVGYALAVGAIGAACVTVLGAVMPFAARAALPSWVRQQQEVVDGVPFFEIYAAAGVTVAEVVVAVVMGVIVARPGPYRPALAVLAGSTAAALSTLVIFFVTDPIACHVNVWDFSPEPARCFGLLYAQSFSRVGLEITVNGVVLAGPVMVLAGALGAAYRRRVPRIVPTTRPTGRLGRAVTTVLLILLVVFAVYVSVLILPLAYEDWLRRTFG
ncbi:M48 family metalloprotease [Micromonospora taraxaci]|uniref:Peptidase M48-like protein n=1 Tax=Micromonospora taraxaci TaxID=1316803 RepID=A0A561W0U0_9ACTN|nr:M48 family metalloprotease [Micromonospora taraxaci]TWG17477.1 peptidase M48-like protein [Micromonospora taraxaci]